MRTVAASRSLTLALGSLVLGACAGPTKIAATGDGGGAPDMVTIFDFATEQVTDGPAPLTGDLTYVSTLDFMQYPVLDFTVAAAVDLSGTPPVDMAGTKPVDMAVAPTPDLAKPVDMAGQKPADLATVADLKTPPCGSGCQPVSFFGNFGAFITNGAQLSFDGNGNASATVSPTNTVSVIIQGYPMGMSASVDLVYAVNDATLAHPTYIVMTYDKAVANNDQWYAVIPAQASGATVSFYLFDEAYAGGSPDYYSNSGTNFHYTSQ